MMMRDYHLRPIEERDLRLVLDWRNSPKVHNMMLTDHEITWEEHYTWFKRMEKQPLNGISSLNIVTSLSGTSVFREQDHKIMAL